jgi:hypothetical protein
MACTITFSNLLNGQEIDLPYTVSGQISPGGAKVIAAARQIDDNPVRDITGDCVPGVQPPVNGDQTFSAELTGADCPLADTYYMLTIYAWDDGSPTVSVASVTFKTSSTSGAVAPDPVPISRIPG